MASDEREKLMNTVKSIMRSILISCKEGIPAHRIEHEYRDLAEEPIPLRKLGFNRVQDFIKAIPDVVRISTNREGGAQLFAVANQETAHIMKMVKAQRNRKVRSKKPLRGPIRRPYNQKPGPWPYQSRYPARPPSNYSSARPTPRPYGKPTTPHGRSFSRPQYNTGSGRPQPSFNSHSYDSSNNPSRPPHRGFGVMSSGSSYQNFSVTVPSRRNGRGVELSYGSTGDDFADYAHPKLASVVIKPPTFNQVRTTKPEVVKYGDKFEVPPRFKGRLDVSGKLPKANEWDPTLQPRQSLLPTPAYMYSNWSSTRAGRENVPRSLPELELPVCIDRGQLYKKLIADYSRRKNLPEPKYDSMSLNQGFLCSLILDGQNYGSLEPFQNKEAAEDAAARTACRSLNIEKGLQGEMEPAPELNNDPKVKERIKEIVMSKPNGIWFTRLPVEYKEKYKTEAPGNLLPLLQSWTDFVKLESNTHVNTYIVYYAKPDVEIPMASLFPLQEKVAVFMSYLSEDGQFYVQRSDNEIDSLTDEVQTVSQLSSRVPGPELKPGLFCVAKYEADNSWCRAQVLNYTPGTDVVEVLFVDYGNEEQVPLESVRKLSDKLAGTPAQAVKCMLHGVAPLEGDLWLGEAIDDFEVMVRNIELQALTNSHNGDMCLVELFSSEESDISINASMVSKGLLKPTVPEYQDLVPSAETNSEASSKAETSIHGPGEPEPLSFPEEQYWNIYISFLSSITNITFRLVGENYSDKLEDLEQELEEGFATFPSLGADLTVGTVCVAEVDGLYHRVRVLEVHDDSTVKCYFLDHGDSDELNRSKLKLIPLELNVLPYQACHCGVAGMDTSNEGVMAQALEKLTNYIHGKTCVAEVVTSYGRHHSVILYDTSGEEDVNINDLVTQEIAKESQQVLTRKSPFQDDLSAPDSDQVSVNSEASTTSGSGRPAQVTVKPKFLQLQSSRDTTANSDTESISSECSSASERPVQLKPKFLSRSHSSSQSPDITADLQSTNDSQIPVLNSVFDADLKLDAACVGSDLRLTNSDLGITSSDLGITCSDFGLMSSDIGMLGSDSGIACPDLQLAISSLRLQDSEQQPNSIEPAMLDEFAQGVSSQSIGTSLSYKVRDVSPHNNSASSTEERYSINPEDIPLPETCSELSSLSDVDFGTFDAKAVDYGYKKMHFPEETTPTPDSSNQMIYDVYAQGDGPHIAGVDIWSPDYLNLPLPPFFQPPGTAEYIDVHVRWVSDPENFVCLPYDNLQEYAGFMTQLGKYLDETPKVRDLEIDEIKVGHLYAGRQGDKWYRAIVKDFPKESLLACIFLADVGEFDVISVDQLQPLPTHFWAMPFQAFRAKLYGASTMDNKAWSEASKYKFMELVLNKDLVGLVRDKDPVSGAVSLELIDTSDDVLDVHINEVFTCHLTSWMDY